MIELTSACSLRCVFCGRSSDPEKHRRAFDLPEERLFQSIRFLQSRGLRGIHVCGKGETTTRKDWDRICRDILDIGVAHNMITTNLARPLSEAEAGVLARFEVVHVSVDTADPDLFSEIRRGAELPTVLANIDRIRDAMPRSDVRGAELRFSIVVTDKTVHGLRETVQLGLQHGVTGFYLAGLYKPRDVAGAVNVYHVKTLPRPELENAIRSLRSAITLARGSGCSVQVHDGLLQSISMQLATATHEMVAGSATPLAEPAGWDAPGLEPGWTRDCLAPWRTMVLYA